MKVLPALSVCLLACTVRGFDVDDFLERLDSTLTLSAFHDVLRARLSGTVDLEAYHFHSRRLGSSTAALTISSTPVFHSFSTLKPDRRFISLLSRGWIAGSIAALMAVKCASMT